MIGRIISSRLEKLLGQFPVVVLIGPRQVGKTTLAKSYLEGHPSAVYLDLELPSDLARLQEPELYLGSHEESLVVIDEVQRRPELFPVLRSLVDQARRPGRFLLLGSASPGLLRQSSESLAGRLYYLELSPFSWWEIREVADLQTHWWRGGYPEALLASGDEEARLWQDGFITTYLERDLPQLGFRIPSPDVRRFLTMLAHNQAQLWNASQLASSLGVSAPTMKRYLSMCEETFLIRVIKPWHINLKKRLVKSPKVYVRDPGIFHALLGIPSFEMLQGHPQLGASWEGYVLEQMMSVLPAGCEVHFYRTYVGAEMDFVITRGLRILAAIEVKNTLSPRPGRGLYESHRDLGGPPTWIVYRGQESYPQRDNLTVMSLSHLLDALAKIT